MSLIRPDHLRRWSSEYGNIFQVGTDCRESIINIANMLMVNPSINEIVCILKLEGLVSARTQTINH